MRCDEGGYQCEEFGHTDDEGSDSKGGDSAMELAIKTEVDGITARTTAGSSTYTTF